MNQAKEEFLKLASNRVKFPLYLATTLPAAFFSGCRVHEINAEKCTVSVPYKWLTKNPFFSTYFASLSMAAEMSTGLLAMSNIYKLQPPVSILLTGMEGRFVKKAVSKTFFTCNQGIEFTDTIQEAIATGEGKTITALSSGSSTTGKMIAEFNFQWSCKVKSGRR